MGLRVNTNIASINAQRALADVTGRLNSSFRRLSTGLRITTAADDAAQQQQPESGRANIHDSRPVRLLHQMGSGGDLIVEGATLRTTR